MLKAQRMISGLSHGRERNDYIFIVDVLGEHGLGLISGIANNWRKAKAATIIQSQLEHYQRVFGEDIAPRQSATNFVDQTWDRHTKAFEGKVVATEGPLEGKPQAKPRVEVLACMTMAEVIDATRHEMTDKTIFYIFLYAFRGVLERCVSGIIASVKKGGAEEAMPGFAVETYHKTVAMPEVKERHPRLLTPLALQSN